ncbi:MAG TPA: HD domain-containing protein [Isosphaeraceae bacterium]|nr:HD domain-containing protein [Isosphaeraceae bacterium]
MHDKFKKRFQAQGSSARLRHQIAVEAARRMFAAIGPRDERGYLESASENDFYVAKRKATAVLGHRLRPGDLPSDAEVREQVLVLARARREGEAPEPLQPEPEGELERMADHIDRFAIYRLRLAPLERVKQNPRHHPEGDALFHSLQVFELARNVRPYDEEFLLAALLHDVGKAIDPPNHVAAALESLQGTLTERTAWLIAHHSEALALRQRTLDPRTKKAIECSEFFDDLLLLAELDDAGRVPGAPVGTIDQALDYVRGLEHEAYLDS